MRSINYKKVCPNWITGCQDICKNVFFKIWLHIFSDWDQQTAKPSQNLSIYKNKYNFSDYFNNKTFLDLQKMQFYIVNYVF